MPPDRYSVQLATATGCPVEGTFLLGESYRPCRLTLLYSGQEIQAEAADFFEALCRVRDRLEAAGLRPICYGARPSGPRARMSEAPRARAASPPPAVASTLPPPAGRRWPAAVRPGARSSRRTPRPPAPRPGPGRPPLRLPAVPRTAATER